MIRKGTQLVLLYKVQLNTDGREVHRMGKAYAEGHARVTNSPMESHGTKAVRILTMIKRMIGCDGKNDVKKRVGQVPRRVLSL